MHLIRDSSKEKPLELEMGWLCEENGFKHTHVPKELVKQADIAGKTALEGSATTTSGSSNAGVESKTSMEVE